MISAKSSPKPKPKTNKQCYDETQKKLLQATPDVADFLIQALSDEQNFTTKERLDIAKEILSKGYAKYLPNGEQKKSENLYKLVLADDVKLLAE